MTDLKPFPARELIADDMTICEMDGIKRQTEKAVYVDFGDCEHWVPKVACQYGVEEDTGLMLIAIKDWKYKQIGL